MSLLGLLLVCFYVFSFQDCRVESHKNMFHAHLSGVSQFYTV